MPYFQRSVSVTVTVAVAVVVAVSVQTVSVQAVYAVASGAAGQGGRAPSFPRKRVGGAPGRRDGRYGKIELDPCMNG